MGGSCVEVGPGSCAGMAGQASLGPTWEALQGPASERCGRAEEGGSGKLSWSPNGTWRGKEHETSARVTDGETTAQKEHERSRLGPGWGIMP